MSETIILNFILTHETKPKVLRLATYESVKEIVNLLKFSLTCETNWTPQQLHYKIRLFNQNYNELEERYTIQDLLNKNLIWDGDDIHIVTEVNSGRMINYFDRATKYLRSICIETNFYEIREEPNHNYMFEWKAIADEVIDNQSLMGSLRVYEKNTNRSEPQLDNYEYYGTSSSSSLEDEGGGT